MKIEVHVTKLAEALAVVTQFASTDKALPALNTVQFNIRDDTLRLLTSDRYTLAEWTFNKDDVPRIEHDVAEVADDETADDETQFALTLDDAKLWHKHIKTIKIPLAVVLLTFEEDQITLHGFDGLVSTVRAAGSKWVPNYERLWPDTMSAVERIGLPSVRLGQFAKAFPGKRDYSPALRFQFNGTSKAIVVTAPGVAEEFRGLIMPVRLAEE